jgi:hypothetical protein
VHPNLTSFSRLRPANVLHLLLMIQLYPFLISFYGMYLCLLQY